MKPSPITLIAALCWGVRLATAATGHVYTYDILPQTRHQDLVEPRRLSPATARLVLAQRVGAEEYHIPNSLSNDDIEALNDYGSRTHLFTQREFHTAFIYVDGVDRPEASMHTLHQYRNFDIASIPSSLATRELVDDLATQSTGRGSDDMFYTAKDMAEFENIFIRLVAENDWSITALLMPSVGEKEEGKSSWGTYEMPGMQSPLRKRQTPHAEKPLDLETTSVSTPVQQSQPTSAFSMVQSTPLTGILPSCFSTQSACESTTRNCTGHGRCYKKYTDASADDNSRSKTCWSCQCSKTTTTNDDGNTVTTKWGGPACQKRDVSVEFWLITLFTISMIFLVCFAIGEVWSMGEEELPSVIGAGVSGPVKR